MVQITSAWLVLLFSILRAPISTTTTTATTNGNNNGDGSIDNLPPELNSPDFYDNPDPVGGFWDRYVDYFNNDFNNDNNNNNNDNNNNNNNTNSSNSSNDKGGFGSDYFDNILSSVNNDNKNNTTNNNNNNNSPNTGSGNSNNGGFDVDYLDLVLSILNNNNNNNNSSDNNNNTSSKDGDKDLDNANTVSEEVTPRAIPSVGRSHCTLNLCQYIQCAEEETCVMTQDCSSFKCMDTASLKFDGTSADSSERRGQCKDAPIFECFNGVCITDNVTKGISCSCDDGWVGQFCENKCPLTCEHGVCNVNGNKPFCNCQFQWEGDRCESLKPDPEGNAKRLAIILSVVFVFLVLILIIIAIILWRKRVIFVLKLVYYFKLYEDDDGKEYDAYVSLTPTPNAEKFVYSMLRPKLEEKGFKLYLQARDSPANDVMSEIIVQALEKSRRTIMIVTADYLNNEWSRFEYLIAQHEMLKLKQKIIPVLLEDVDKELIKSNKSLKTIMESIKCLHFPQPKTVGLFPSTSLNTEDALSPSICISPISTTGMINTVTSKNNNGKVMKESRKLEHKEDKFWKRLELSMPKKKKDHDSSQEKLGSHQISKDKKKAYIIPDSSVELKSCMSIENELDIGRNYLALNIPIDEGKENERNAKSMNANLMQVLNLEAAVPDK